MQALVCARLAINDRKIRKKKKLVLYKIYMFLMQSIIHTILVCWRYLYTILCLTSCEIINLTFILMLCKRFLCSNFYGPPPDTHLLFLLVLDVF